MTTAMNIFTLAYLCYSLFETGLGLHLYKVDPDYNYDFIDANYVWYDYEMENRGIVSRYFYIAEYYGPEEHLQLILNDYMYSIETKIVDNFYTAVTFARSFKELTLEELTEADPMFSGLHNNYRGTRYLKSSSSQRNIETDSSYLGHKMNVDKVWTRGYTGSGIKILIIDDGIDTTHIDLVDSYNESISYDPTHAADGIGHGTWMAGVIAGANNTHCGTGIAFSSTIGATRLLDTTNKPVSVSSQTLALVRNLDDIDIYTCGFGPIDDGNSFSLTFGPSPAERAAFYKGVTEGRGGKGSIYVWAAGNGGGNYDDCNTDGYVNSVYTLAVTSLTANGELDEDAEPCSAIIASVYASGISTTDKNGGCKTDFSGSSAAAATASGIIALILEANTNLTWRDVQHIIVDTAVVVPGMSEESINGAGKQYSNYYGFGLMNAELMLDAALSWTNVQPLIEYFGPLVTFDGIGEHGEVTVSLEYEITDCPVAYIENVVVYLQFRSLWREYTSVYLISPSNTESLLLRQRNYDYEFTDVIWYFSSLAFWGESANGTWRVELRSSYADNYMKIQQVELAISGTAEVPVESEITYIAKEITDTDIHLIIGASIGAAVGFVILSISMVVLMKALVQELTKNQVQQIESIIEEIDDEAKKTKVQVNEKHNIDPPPYQPDIKKHKM